MKQGYIHIYHGDGKGKTTAALGLILRAAGCEMPVVLVQFLKNSASGELISLSKLENVTILRGKDGQPFTFSMTEEQKKKTKEIHNDNLQKAIALVQQNKCDLLVLDEVLDAYRLQLLDEELLKNLVLNKPKELELVMTGRNPEPFLLEAADYITYMKKEKHPYDQGIHARLGIEY